VKVLLVASSGGHLMHLWWLEPWWREHERTWVTFDTADAAGRLGGEAVYWAVHPTNRRPDNVLRNLRRAARILRRERPDVVVSSGAGVALPFLAVAKVLGIATVFVEVYDRVDRPSLTARLVAKWVDRLVLQWPEQQVGLPSGRVLGPMVDVEEAS
jgi:hypothetical protein